MIQELGLPISDSAIEQMKNNLELDEEQFKIAAVEEKKRRRRSSLQPVSLQCWMRVRD